MAINISTGRPTRTPQNLQDQNRAFIFTQTNLNGKESRVNETARRERERLLSSGAVGEVDRERSERD